MTTPVRIEVQSLDCSLSTTVRLVVESQGDPRRKLLAFELDREALIKALINQSGWDSAHNQTTFLDGSLVQARA